MDPQDEVVPLAQLAGLAELVLGQGPVVGVEELQEGPLAELLDRAGRGTPRTASVALSQRKVCGLEAAEHLVGRDDRAHRGSGASSG